MKKALTVLTLVLLLSVFGYSQNLAVVINALGTRESTLTIFKQYDVTADLTVPTNITLKFLQGGSLNISTGQTVTINGHVEAGLYTIFEWAGTGKVVFGANAVKEIYPQWWGAKGDNANDDTAEIQAAFTAVPVKGATVSFSPGTFLISPPTTDYIFDIESNTHIMGCGIGISIIKVKDAAGKYKVIFGLAEAELNNISITDLTIDQNSTNNAVAADITTFKQKLIETTGGSRNLVIDNIECKDWLGIHVIYSGNINTSITNSRFIEVGGGATFFDHSTIYVHAEGVVISDNIFISSGIDSAGAVTAIETHGGNTTVTGNIIQNYFRGMNITGVTLTDSENIVVNGNTINGAYIAITIWSMEYGAHTTGFGVAGVNIADNSIKIKQTSWTINPNNGAAVIGNMKGITVDGAGDLPLKILNITHNTVEFDLESEIEAVNTASIGIGYYDNTNSNEISTFKISGNIILNAPVCAIRVAVDAENVEISDNQIINPGSSLGALAATYRVGMLFSGTNALKNVRILNNTIIDNIATTRMVYGIYLATAAGSDLILDNNIVAITGLTDITAFLKPYDVNTGTQLPLILGMVSHPNFLPSQLPALTIRGASRIIDIISGRTWICRQSGNVWFAQGAGTTSPTSEVWVRGSIYTKTNPAAGATPGWVCVRGENSPANGGEPAAEDEIAVDDDKACAIGDIVGFQLDNGDWHWSSATNVVGNVITINDAIPGGRNLPDNNIVYWFCFKAMANLGA